MNWDGVQTEALKRGWLIYAMDQGQTYVTNTQGPWGSAALGYCLGLTVRWIALRYGGSEYAYDRKTRVLEAPDWRTTRDQNIYENSAAMGDFPEELIPVYAQFGLTLNKGRVTNQSSVVTASMLRAAGGAGEGCYHVVLSREGGRHGVAMHNEGGGNWRFFDPNYGCFWAKSDKDFEKFIGWYLAKTGYGKKYTVGTNIVAVNPPPYVNGAFATLVKDLIKMLGD
jgi:hypothetical protein